MKFLPTLLTVVLSAAAAAAAAVVAREDAPPPPPPSPPPTTALIPSQKNLFLNKRDIDDEVIFLRPELVECETSYQEHNRTADTVTVEQYLFHWIRWNNRVYPEHPERGPVEFIDSCSNTAVYLVRHTPEDKQVFVTSREASLMAIAVIDYCRQGSRAKGRAWDPKRRFTIEVGFGGESKKCRH